MKPRLLNNTMKLYVDLNNPRITLNELFFVAIACGGIYYVGITRGGQRGRVNGGMAPGSMHPTDISRQ